VASFSKKNIIVTGSTRGIGRAIAEALVAEGAIVGINGRSEEAVELACAEIGASNTVPLPQDLSQPDAGAAVVSRFLESCETVDGLVNNAGFGQAAPFRAMTTTKWQNTFQLNLESAMTASREAYNSMRKQKSGCIVNISSVVGHGPGKWMGADYAASKAALVSMTKSLAFVAARLNVSVNAVSPGVLETDLTSMLTGAMKDDLPIPMKRFGKPTEIASTVLWLLSDDSAYITGQVLHVDGGLYM
jgi:3-oxoacyl-[acyl-carrier protein] reductase